MSKFIPPLKKGGAELLLALSMGSACLEVAMVVISKVLHEDAGTMRKVCMKEPYIDLFPTIVLTIANLPPIHQLPSIQCPIIHIPNREIIFPIHVLFSEPPQQLLHLGRDFQLRQGCRCALMMRMSEAVLISHSFISYKLFLVFYFVISSLMFSYFILTPQLFLHFLFFTFPHPPPIYLTGRFILSLPKSQPLSLTFLPPRKNISFHRQSQFVGIVVKNRKYIIDLMLQISKQEIIFSKSNHVETFTINNNSQQIALYKIKTNNVTAVDAKPNQGELAPHQHLEIKIRKTKSFTNVKLQLLYMLAEEHPVNLSKVWKKTEERQSIIVNVSMEQEEGQGQGVLEGGGTFQSMALHKAPSMVSSIQSKNSDFEPMKSSSESYKSTNKEAYLQHLKTKTQKSQTINSKFVIPCLIQIYECQLTHLQHPPHILQSFHSKPNYQPKLILATILFLLFCIGYLIGLRIY